ncbi:DNA-directed RNA polymerase subunit beta [Nocardia sp. CA-128927]|uniref:DNA-directed RNA polymerase subunit beta n=1 Tax=Nocardia sp. CA-128927 TaxID=3239975 RepID=UPI003D999217
MENTELLPDKQAAVLESQRRFYQVTCGLPARVRLEYSRIEFRVGSVGAVTMPALLGALVKAHMLAQRNGRVGPIVSHPRSKRWTFLVCPDIPGDASLSAKLFRYNVSVVPIGGEVALPSLFDTSDPSVGYREWVHKPSDGYRPPGTEIVEAIRCCVSALPSSDSGRVR